MKVEERLFDDASAEAQALADAKQQSQQEIRELKALILDRQQHVCILTAVTETIDGHCADACEMTLMLALYR